MSSFSFRDLFNVALDHNLFGIITTFTTHKIKILAFAGYFAEKNENYLLIKWSHEGVRAISPRVLCTRPPGCSIVKESGPVGVIWSWYLQEDLTIQNKSVNIQFRK